MKSRVGTGRMGEEEETAKITTVERPVGQRIDGLQMTYNLVCKLSLIRTLFFGLT